MFGIGIAIGIGVETAWPTSKSISIPNPVPMISQCSDAKTIHNSEHIFGSRF